MSNPAKTPEQRAARAEKARAERASETPEQREARLAKRRARYSSAEWLEKHREDCRVYYRENKGKFKEYELRRRATPRAKEYDLIRTRRRNGIANPTAETKVGACAIVGCSYEGSLVLDHWHHGPKKGEVRGWLCSNCNAGLGFFGDSPDRMRGAAVYIEVASSLPVDTDQPAD